MCGKANTQLLPEYNAYTASDCQYYSGEKTKKTVKKCS